MVLLSLGFFINWEKSVLIPTQILVFLGFIINSITMTVSLTSQKVDKFLDFAHYVLGKETLPVREVEKLVGMMTSYSNGVEYGELHAKRCEEEKNWALALHQGDYDEM